MFELTHKVFTAYETSETYVDLPELGRRFDTLQGLEDLNHADLTALDFSRFWTERILEDAVNAATGAELIVVSLSGRSDLPVPVQRWMESWPYYQLAEHTALVVVFAAILPDCPKQAALIAYFQQIADYHGLEFFCNAVPSAERPRQPAGFEVN